MGILLLIMMTKIRRWIKSKLKMKKRNDLNQSEGAKYSIKKKIPERTHKKDHSPHIWLRHFSRTKSVITLPKDPIDLFMLKASRQRTL